MEFKTSKIILLLVIGFGFNVDAQNPVTKIKKSFGLDKRTSVFEIVYDSVNQVVKGKTDQNGAKNALLKTLKNVKDSIEVLPQQFKYGFTHALVNVSVANLRSNPEEWAELSSQILLGTPLLLLEKHKGWYRVKCPDQYIGWVDGSTIKSYTKKQIEDYYKKDVYIYLQNNGFATSDTLSESLPVRDLSFGNIFSGEIVGSFLKIKFPDHKIGFIKLQSSQEIFNWTKSIINEPSEVIKKSMEMTGIPYLWGGTSFKGVDCSGFTRMVYLKQGVLLPRDASQQVLIGDNITLDQNFENLRKGDLLFFGNIETKKITHVGIWIENKQFIHSSGMVHISSFDPKHENYDEYNLNRLISVKRIPVQILKKDPKFTFPYSELFSSQAK